MNTDSRKESRVMFLVRCCKKYIDISFEYNKIQPYQFEPLASENHLSDSESSNDEDEQDGVYDINDERIGQVDWWDVFLTVVEEYVNK